MKIRPLHKIRPGLYETDDRQWHLREFPASPFRAGKENRNSPEFREWFAYKRMLDNNIYYDTPYFFSPYPTLKSLIKALEKAKP